MPRTTFLTVVAVFVSLLLTAPIAGQDSKFRGIKLPEAAAEGAGMGNVPVKYGDPVQQQQARQAAADRELEIRRDTEKMAQLSAELKDYLDKSVPGVLSLDAIKKVEQIEKLAKGVKSKMKQSY